MSCPHCKFIEGTFKETDKMTNREYWIMTEVFVYLHGGKDYCDWEEKKKPVTLKEAFKTMATLCKDQNEVIKIKQSKP